MCPISLFFNTNWENDLEYKFSLSCFKWYDKGVNANILGTYMFYLSHKLRCYE